MTKTVLFDGECHFCDQSVQFIIKRDPKAIYSFASLQSEVGIELLIKYNVPKDINSLVLLEGRNYYLKSTAALRICQSLTGIWKLFSLLLMIPAPIRDFMYEIVANNRYEWFGKKESCNLPSQEIRKRFL
jgi:predicted DCC family thiol-disulfide oxidoreductase YuxK